LESDKVLIGSAPRTCAGVLMFSQVKTTVMWKVSSSAVEWRFEKRRRIFRSHKKLNAMGRLSSVKSVVEFSGCWRTYGYFLASVWGRPKSHGTRLPCHIPRADEHILLFCNLCSDLIPLVPAWVPNSHTRIRRANRSWQYDSYDSGSRSMGLEGCTVLTVIITFLVEYL